MPTRKAITGATNASPIVVTAVGHGFSTANQVLITDVGGNTAANGVWVITVVDADNFLLKGGSVGNGNYTSGGFASLVTAPLDIPAGTTELNLAEATTTTGTGAITLAGAIAGSLPFATLENGTVVDYKIVADDNSQFEEGIGTYNESGNSLARTEVIASSDGEVSNTPVNLAAGSKTITTLIPIDSSSVAQGAVPQYTDAAPTYFNGGILSMRNSDAIENDRGRCGPAASVIYLRELASNSNNDRAYISLLQTSQSVAGGAAPITAAQLTQRIVRVRYSQPIIFGDGSFDLRVNQPSALPFTVDNNKLNAYATMLARRPADIFVYLPHQIPGQPVVIPRLFYLNWFNSSARNNGNAGAPVGHDIAESANGWSHLAVTGAFSTYITDTSVYAALAKRYVYLGTVVGLTDGTVICQDNKRGMWNNDNRMLFGYNPAELTDRWSPPGAALAVGRNRFTRMNGSNYTNLNGKINDSPWTFFSVVGKASATVNRWPAFTFGINIVGNLRAKVAAYDSAGTGVDLRDSNSPNTDPITPDIANDADVTSRRRILADRKVAIDQIGYRVYQAMQALGSAGGVMTQTPFFIGTGAQSASIAISGEC